MKQSRRVSISLWYWHMRAVKRHHSHPPRDHLTETSNLKWTKNLKPDTQEHINKCCLNKCQCSTKLLSLLFLITVTNPWDCAENETHGCPTFSRYSSAVNVSRHRSSWLAARSPKERLETCLWAHSGIAEGPAVPQCKKTSTHQQVFCCYPLWYSASSSFRDVGAATPGTICIPPS